MIIKKNHNNIKEKKLYIKNKCIISLTKYKNNKGKYNYKIKIPCLYRHNYANQNKSIFYLKVNRFCDYTFKCLQNWIDIIHIMDGIFFIICDKQELSKAILEKITFYNEDINIISSYTQPFKKYVNNLADKSWINAANAHLTTYYHAKQNNFCNFWNIDADDTMILIPPQKVSAILNNISDYAQKNNIDNFSLDMWKSRTAGRQWSFGITYTQMKIDYFAILAQEKNLDWKKYRSDNLYIEEASLDCYFTYCHNKNIMKNETFYIENSQFIHWGNFFTSPFSGGISYWHKNNLQYPILDLLMGDSTFSNTNIATECIKFEYNITKEEGFQFMQNMFINSLEDKYLDFIKKYFK